MPTSSYFGLSDAYNQMIFNDTMSQYSDGLYTGNTLGGLFPQPQQQNSLNFNEVLNPTLKGVQTLGSLANIWMGFQNIGIAKDYLSMSKDQWAQTKSELDRIKNVRTKISQSYME